MLFRIKLCMLLEAVFIINTYNSLSIGINQKVVL